MKPAMIKAMRNFAALHSCELRSHPRAFSKGFQSRWSVNSVLYEDKNGVPVWRDEEDDAEAIMRTILSWAAALVSLAKRADGPFVVPLTPARGETWPTPTPARPNKDINRRRQDVRARSARRKC